MESRTQGSRPRPRTQEKSAAKVKDSLSDDKSSRGQGQECSRLRSRTKDTTRKSSPKKKVFAPKICKFSEKFRRSQKKRKKGLRSQNSSVLQEKMSSKFFSQALWRSLRRNNIGHELGPSSTSQKIVLSSSREQGHFRGLAGFEIV